MVNVNHNVSFLIHCYDYEFQVFAGEPKGSWWRKQRLPLTVPASSLL